MAYVANDDEDENNPNTNPSQGPVTPGGAGGVRLSASSAPASGGGTSAAPAKDAGGQFASLGDYLNANQGQAQPLADKITGGVNDQYNTLNQQNQSVLGGINSAVNSGSTPNDPNVLSQEAANPTSFASDPNNVKQFQSLLNDSYSGPTSAESDSGYQNQQAAINSAISQGQAQTQTPAGQQQLVSQNSARPTAGVTALNSAILSEDPTALGQIQNAYTPFSNLVTGLNSGAQGIDSNIAKTQADAQSASTAANKAIADQTAGLNTDVNNSLNKQQQTYQDYETGANNLSTNLQNGVLPTGNGVDPGLNAFIQNNINPWLSANGGSSFEGGYNFSNAIPTLPAVAAPTISTAATPQQYQLFQALSQLASSPISSPLAGTTAATTPYAVPTLPAVNNQALAGDIQNGITNGPALQVNAPAYNQYEALLAALQKYQGLPQTYYPNTAVPTIA